MVHVQLRTATGQSRALIFGSCNVTLTIVCAIADFTRLPYITPVVSAAETMKICVSLHDRPNEVHITVRRSDVMCFYKSHLYAGSDDIIMQRLEVSVDFFLSFYPFFVSGIQGFYTIRFLWPGPNIQQCSISTCVCGLANSLSLICANDILFINSID